MGAPSPSCGGAALYALLLVLLVPPLLPLRRLLSAMGRPGAAAMEQVSNEHGQAILRLRHPSGALCEVYLFGATVTKFVTASGRDLIWVSDKSKLDGTKAIRGGIPLVFPQFGQPDQRMAQHGFVRGAAWRLAEGAERAGGAGGDVRVVLSVDDTVATHEAWPYPYRLDYTVTLGSHTLTTSLAVHNLGKEAFSFQALQHTYLSIGDIAGTTVSGLQGAQYLDKTSEDPEKLRVDERATAGIAQFTDRVYVPPAGGKLRDPVLVTSPLGNVIVSRSAARRDAAGAAAELPVDTVVWNPWAEKAAGMADFERDGFLRMLCVEPGLVGGFTQLEAGASATLTQVLRDPDGGPACSERPYGSKSRWWCC